MNKKKVLIICPVVPYPENGAEQSDRANGIRQLIRLGYEVKIIAKRRLYQKDDDIQTFSRSVGNVSVITVPYKYAFFEQTFFGKLKILFKRLSKFSYLDGAAFEFTDPEIQNVVKKKINNWKPDIVWFEYTYLWPLYHLVIQKNIPIVTRSLNYEPSHFLDEDGKVFLNRIKVLPKYLSEQKIIKYSDLVCAITPKEEKIYQKLGAKNVIVLPLRGLHKLEMHIPRSKEIIKQGPINLFFMGSTYNVSHNREAARFIVEDLAPVLLKRFGQRFSFHIIGGKLPKDLECKITPNVKYMGYVQNLEDFLKEMDCAIVPSLYGAGMQQKIFEPLMRGFPTIVSYRGLSDYSFIEHKEILCANSLEDFILSLEKIESNYEYLVSLGKNAYLKARSLFNIKNIDKILDEALHDL